MSKKWTEVDQISDTIVDHKEFNAGYNAYKSSINGGLDRSMIPAGLVSNTILSDGTMHKVDVFDRAGLLDTSASAPRDLRVDETTTIIDYFPKGPTYNTYSGGYLELDSFQVLKYKEGMCHWECKFHYTVNTMYAADNTVSGPGNGKAIVVRLTWDGETVFESSELSLGISTIRLIADFPVSGGTHTAKVFVKFSPPGTQDKSGIGALGSIYGINAFNFFCPSHLLIGRWR